jgi:hypothetical protein
MNVTEHLRPIFSLRFRDLRHETKIGGEAVECVSGGVTATWELRSSTGSPL